MLLGQATADGALSALLVMPHQPYPPAPALQGCPLQQVVQQVIACKGPVAAGTSPQAVRLHDDRSTYSGTSAHGTPASADRRDASSVRDRWGTTACMAWHQSFIVESAQLRSQCDYMCMCVWY